MKAKMIAAMAFLVVAFAALIAVAPSPAEVDAEGQASYQTTMYPVVYGQSDNGVRAILYDDGILMLDMGGVASSIQGNTDLFKVTVTNSTKSIVLEHQATTQGKLYVDLSQKDSEGEIDMCTQGEVTIVIQTEETTPGFEGEITLDVPELTEKMKLIIYDGSTTGTSGGDRKSVV